MQPSDGLWDGVGAGIASSPGWMVVGTVLVIGVLFVVAKYIYPGHKEIKMRELDIRQMEAENAKAQVESNRALAEQTRSAGAKVDALVIQNAELVAGIEESKTRSRGMGSDLASTRETAERIKETTDATQALVQDIHAAVVPRRVEGTD